MNDDAISRRKTVFLRAKSVKPRYVRLANPDFLLGGRTSASAECRHWSGRAVRWSSCAILLRATLAMPLDTGNMISFIRFRSMPVPQQSERKFQIVLDVPAAV